MKQIITAALAASILAGPAYASDWYSISVRTGQCFQDGTSPSDYYRRLQSRGYVPTIVEDVPGRVLVEEDHWQSPTGVAFFRSLSDCEKARQVETGDLQNYN